MGQLPQAAIRFLSVGHYPGQITYLALRQIHIWLRNLPSGLGYGFFQGRQPKKKKKKKKKKKTKKQKFVSRSREPQCPFDREKPAIPVELARGRDFFLERGFSPHICRRS